VGNKILFIDHYLLRPDSSAGDLRMFSVMRIMRELGWEVSFIPANLAYSDEHGRVFENESLEVLYHPRIDSIEAHLAEVGAKYDVVLISRPDVAEAHLPAARKHCQNAEIIYDAVDLYYRREMRQGRVLDDPQIRAGAEEKKRLELDVMGRSDRVFVVSSTEQSIVQEQIPGSEVEVIPTFYEPKHSLIPYEMRKHLLFIGGFEHPPNADAIDYFVGDIFPRVRKKLRRIKFFVLGSKPPDRVKAMVGPDIYVTGFLDDVSSFFSCCRVFVAPIRFGAGTCGKVNHSLSLGLPAVTSPVAAEGLELEHGKESLIADDPKEFASAVVELYRNPVLWNRLSANGRKKIENEFSYAAIRDRLARIFALERNE
jgi:glycosyltransferase involved in cell wall biosynthesis